MVSRCFSQCRRIVINSWVREMAINVEILREVSGKGLYCSATVQRMRAEHLRLGQRGKTPNGSEDSAGGSCWLSSSWPRLFNRAVIVRVKATIREHGIARLE